MPKPQPPAQPSAQPPTARAADAPQETPAKPVFDWSELKPAKTMENKPSGTAAKANVLVTVNEFIRQRAEASLTTNTERVAAGKKSSAKRARVEYHWQVQPLASKAMADEFVRQITRYAKYRPSEGEIPHAGANSPRGQVTARCGAFSHYRENDEGAVVACSASDDGAFIGVRFSVRPFEQRSGASRAPGTA